MQEKPDVIHSLSFALGAGSGFTLALLIMSGIRERLELSDISCFYPWLPPYLETQDTLKIPYHVREFQGNIGV